MNFEFATAGRIVFGPGSVRTVGAAARSFGATALLVTGRNPDRCEPVRASLREADVRCAVFTVSGEPTVEIARSGVQFYRAEDCAMVVACGGGSAIDAGKAIAALVPNSGEPLDYLEVVGRGAPLEAPPVPFIAVPTTAGTGSEVTRNAVLGSPEHRVKASLRSASMLAKLAVVDPELTLGLPLAITASTGLDALTQLIEPYVSCKANPMTDLYCVEGIRRVTRSLRTAYREGLNVEARTDMAYASLLGGLALANAGLGVVHGFAAPIGGAFDAPHGAICAALLPHAIEVNMRALEERAPQSIALQRYREVAQIAKQICSDLDVPALSAYGVQGSDIDGLVEKAIRASSTKGNPIVLTAAELRDVIEPAI